jgi:hypothetical protein
MSVIRPLREWIFERADIRVNRNYRTQSRARRASALAAISRAHPQNIRILFLQVRRLFSRARTVQNRKLLLTRQGTAPPPCRHS